MIFLFDIQSTLDYIRERYNNVTSQSEKVKLLNPRLQLKRGFSIATDKQHNIIYSLNQLKLDDVVNVQEVIRKVASNNISCAPKALSPIIPPLIAKTLLSALI